MGKLEKIFGQKEASAIRFGIQNAKIVEVYDNAVDMEISTQYGRYIFGVYCYYKDGDISRPIAGAIDYDADEQYYDFSDDTFTQTERESLQKILDSHEFEEGHFLDSQSKER